MKKVLITGANRGLGYELLKVYMDTHPSIAAENIYRWIDENGMEFTGKYIEPNIKEISW